MGVATIGTAKTANAVCTDIEAPLPVMPLSEINIKICTFCRKMNICHDAPEGSVNNDHRLSYKKAPKLQHVMPLCIGMRPQNREAPMEKCGMLTKFWLRPCLYLGVFSIWRFCAKYRCDNGD